MANNEHLEILERGVAAWNAWREENPGAGPDLINTAFDKEQQLMKERGRGP